MYNLFLIKLTTRKTKHKYKLSISLHYPHFSSEFISAVDYNHSLACVPNPRLEHLEAILYYGEMYIRNFTAVLINELIDEAPLRRETMASPH